MKRTFQFFSFLICFVLSFSICEAQNKTNFNYAAQKQFIPAELGRVYLGMPFLDFAANFDFLQSEVDDRFDFLQISIPFNKGNITKIYFKVHGLSQEETKKMLSVEKVTEKDEFGDYEREVKRLDVTKIPAKGFVYELNLAYKPEFDLKSWVLKTYGKPDETGKKGDEYYFFDSQWTKKTTDGLTWLIRAYHEEGKSLKLAGRIDGTEWGLD